MKYLRYHEFKPPWEYHIQNGWRSSPHKAPRGPRNHCASTDMSQRAERIGEGSLMVAGSDLPPCGIQHCPWCRTIRPRDNQSPRRSWARDRTYFPVCLRVKPGASNHRRDGREWEILVQDSSTARGVCTFRGLLKSGSVYMVCCYRRESTLSKHVREVRFG